MARIRGKKLTYRMKKYLSDKMRLDADQWLYTKNTQKEFVIINRDTGAERTINKVERNITDF